MKKLLISLLFALIFLSAFSSAYTITFNPSSASANILQGQSQSVTINYIATNPDNATTANIVTSNFPNGILTASVSSLSIPSGSSSGSFNLIFSTTSSVSLGNYSAWIQVGTIPLFTSLNIINPNQCQIQPSLSSLTQQVQSGTSLPISKITFNPINCPSSLVLSSSNVVVEGGIVTQTGQKPVFISSIVSDGINLGIDTSSLSTQTYVSHLKINAFSQIFDIPFTIIVTSGTTVSGNFSVNQLPSCSLSSTTLSLNQTYSFICTMLPDITVVPRVNNIIEGVGVDSTSSQSIYYFKANQMGTTKFIADFYYRGNPVSTPFSSDIKVVAGSYSQGGTTMIFKFFPELYDSKDGVVVVNVIDNTSNNLVQNAVLFLDGAQLNNNTLHLEQNKNYELRASSFGYADIVQIIALSQKPINFTLLDSYTVGSSLNFDTNPANATILYDGEIITLPFTLKETGVHTITASFLGYSSTSKNITINQNPSLLDALSQENKKVGATAFVRVDKNDTKLSIIYQSDPTVPPVTLNETTGDYISAKMDKTGTYDFYGDGVLLTSYVLESHSIFSSFWFWAIVIVVVIVLVVIIFMSRSSAPASQPITFGVGQPGED